MAFQDLADQIRQLQLRVGDFFAELRSATPAGIVSSYAGTAAPEGWLICDGSAVSRTDYRALFAVIGTTYGAGNGSSTFNVPDLSGRFVAGHDGELPEFDTLGEAGGARTHAHGVEGTAWAQLSWEASGRVRMNRDGTGPAFAPDVMTVSSNLAPLGADTGGTTNNAIALTGGTGDGSSLPPYLTLTYIIRAR